jgi:hypothetical protein
MVLKNWCCSDFIRRKHSSVTPMAKKKMPPAASLRDLVVQIAAPSLSWATDQARMLRAIEPSRKTSTGTIRVKALGLKSTFLTSRAWSVAGSILNQACRLPVQAKPMIGRARMSIQGKSRLAIVSVTRRMEADQPASKRWCARVRNNEPTHRLRQNM